MKRMNFIKKTISFLTIICCLAGSLLPAYTAGAAGGSNPGQIGYGKDDDTDDTPAGAPHVTFINEPNNSPDLFVEKVVKNEVSGAQYAAPERAAYRFILKINGEIARNVEYRLLDSRYGELAKKRNGGKEPFKTDKNSGVFTLEDGQTAWFEYVGTGAKYEVIELPDYYSPIMEEKTGTEKEKASGYELCIYNAAENKLGDPVGKELVYELRSLYADGYEQRPAGDAVNGASTGEKTILFNGNRETFTNRYTGKGTGDTTTLKISKSVSFPTGYTVPETPDFRFKVELDGEPYAGKAYTVVDADGKPVMTTGRLQIPDADEVAAPDENGEPTPGEGETATSGENGEPTPGEGEEAAPGENGEPTPDEEEESVPGEETPVPLTGITDENGVFTLKGGQTAVFEGIPTNQDYKVSELLESEMEDSTGFGKWWAVGGTEKKGSTQAPLTSVSFNNANVSFVVTKRLEDYSKPDVEFAFRLSDDNNVPLTGKSYYLYNTNGLPVYDETGKQVMGSTGTEEGEEGAFRLKPGQAAVFVGMEPGTAFRVSEEGNPDYTQVLPLPTDNSIYTVPANGNLLYIDFVNKPADNEGVLTVTKKLTFKEEGPTDNGDFHFILYKQLKTEEEVKAAFDVWKLWFIEIGSVTEEKIDKKAESGEIALLQADNTLSGTDSGTGDETDSLPDYIKIVNGVCCYEKDGKLYELYVPVENAVYSVQEGLSSSSYRTGSGEKAGEFTIKADQTARFELLRANCKYMVREIRLTGEYTEDTASGLGSGSYTQLYIKTGTGAGEGNADAENALVYAQSAELTGSAGTAFIFVNHYTPKKVDLTLTKLDSYRKTITDYPAEFMLYRAKGRVNPVYEGVYSTKDAEGNVTGKLTFPDLKPGTYWLYELKAPSGYKLLTDPIEIQIAWDENGELKVTVDGKALESSTPSEGGNKDVVPSAEIVKSEGSAENGENAYTIRLSIVNADFYRLPNSGGRGIYWYMIGGILLMMAATLILYRKKRAGEVLKD